MAYNINDIEGIGPAFGAKLNALGINTTEELQAKGATKAGRKALATAALH
jgi:predicted flap endonuclease-1-like 5' DNA nuclease